MRIARVEAIPLREPDSTDAGGWWVTTPLDVFAESPRGERQPPPPVGRSADVTNVLVRVHTDDGRVGHGLVGVGTRSAVIVIEELLAPHVVGKSPFDVEKIWQTMYLTTLNKGRKGLLLEAISGIDIALWDLMGQIVEQPVYNLLGGKTKESIRAYASQCYARSDPAEVAAEAAHYAAEGFTAVKMRAGYGPTDGRMGMRKNEALVAAVREAVGPDVEVMLDVYMAWNVPYAIEMIRRLEKYDLSWVEEPVQPDNMQGYARIRNSVGIPIAGGEHEFTRYGFRELIASGAVDILQPDVNRIGGITEARKIWAMASAHDLDVIPHSPFAHNVHLIVSALNSPLIEYFPHDSLRYGYTFPNELFRGEASAVDGCISVGATPGLGISVVEEVLKEHRVDPLR